MQSQKSDLSASASSCPSFSTYSENSTAKIADRVSHEFAGDEDFEFAFARGDEAEIGPVFPVFDQDLLSGDSGEKLGFRGGEDEALELPSSSSSEADELDSVPEGTYCVWTPRGVPATPGRCKKSRSTGSTSSPSKRWRIRDLLRRSHSDGKESLVFLSPPIAVEQDAKSPAENPRRSSAGKGKDLAAAHEAFYVRNRSSDRTVEKRRSTFLPYRQDLVGLFANVNTMGRTFPPF